MAKTKTKKSAKAKRAKISLKKLREEKRQDPAQQDVADINEPWIWDERAEWHRHRLRSMLESALRRAAQ